MRVPGRDRLAEALRAANRGKQREALRHLLDRPGRRLAVYGSLVPGEENHGVVADLAGEWEEGIVRGHLLEEGWGTSMGYPALRWDPEGPAVSVHLLTSDDLPEAWDRLDRFEGPAYRRVWVPVELGDDRTVVANLYVAAERVE